MASEIRVNKIENRSGLGTVTFADTGVDLAGIVTATTFSGSGASLTSLPAAQVTGTLPAISAANLTNIPAANVTGTLPAISAANLTNLPAANVTGTLPAISAANLTNIPAANIVGVCTAGLSNASGVLAGVTMVDSWIVDSSYFQDSGNQFITSNWVKHANGSSNLGFLGSNMSESSGVFTFPSTGIYMVTCTLAGRTDGGSAAYSGMRHYFSNNSGSSYSIHASGYGQAYADTAHFCVSQTVIYDVTNVSTARIKFDIENSSRIKIFGNATNKNTGVVFVRLGDT